MAPGRTHGQRLTLPQRHPRRAGAGLSFALFPVKNVTAASPVPGGWPLCFCLSTLHVPIVFLVFLSFPPSLEPSGAHSETGQVVQRVPTCPLMCSPRSPFPNAHTGTEAGTLRAFHRPDDIDPSRSRRQSRVNTWAASRCRPVCAS